LSQKVNLSKFNNDWYSPDGNAITRILWFFVNAIFFQSFNPISSLKCSLLRLFGAKIGVGVVIKPYVNIKYPWRLEIGNHVWIGENVWIDNLADIKIGDNACISQGAMLLTGSHDYKKEAFDLMTGEITLEEGSWVGAKSVVCPSVTLKSHSILSVNSVATRDLEAYKIYQGNPAVEKRDRVIES
jgi:putative colanic acid biosynthesis acetyltransferase WcaF